MMVVGALALVVVVLVVGVVARTPALRRPGLAALAAIAVGVAGAVLGGPVGPIGALLGIGAGAHLVWLLLFSERAGTATPEIRRRLAHLLFVPFFAVYTAGIAAWLATGLVAGIAGHSHGFHDRLHAYGGAPAIVKVEASEAAPFKIEGSSRIREMTFRAGAPAAVELTNSPADPATACDMIECSVADVEEGVPLEHSISIYRHTGEPVFVGERTIPERRAVDDEERLVLQPTTRTYTFDAPEEGSYEYRCDVHPLIMRGTVRVLPATAPLTHPETDQSLRDTARRIAGVSHQAEGTAQIALDYAFSIVSLGLGVFLVLLRPRERMARVFGVAMVGTAAAYNLQSHAALAVHTAFDDPLHTYLHPITGIAYIYALVLFPDGRLVPQFRNRAVRLGYRVAFFLAAMIFLGVTGSILPDFNQHPAALVLTFGMAIPVIGMIAQGVRLRRAATSEARQQSRLLLLALATSFAVGLVLLLAVGLDLRTLVHPTGADPIAIGAADARAFRVFQPLFVLIPVALFAGILRYRLWDIDLVVSRTLVYGALAGFIGTVYVGVVVGLGGAVGGRTGLSIAATVLVAVAFDPLRARLQRVANRLVYGERASPYEVMADLSHRIAGVSSAAEVLPAIAEGVASGVGATRARATLHLPAGGRISGVWPQDDVPDPTYDRTITLSHLGETVGELAVGKRPGDPLRAAENRLLETIGDQIALALHSLRLADRLRGRLEDLRRTTAQLEASRRRIVSAQDAERNRLEREIHDRVESRLVAIAATIDGAERSLPRRRVRGIALLEEAAGQANDTQDALRDVARGIFPPLLADRGLVSALESHARKMAAPVAVRAAGLDGRFDPHAEAAAYFCCIEGLRSSERRADGSPIEVEVASDGDWVAFEVRDRAHGIGERALGGADLQVMVDRIEAVGGRLEVRASPEGTTIAGRVPAQPLAAAQISASRSGPNADFAT